MKAWRCLVVLSFLLLGGCLVTFKEPIPPREAAPSHLLGTWSRENEWKEEQFLEITRSGSNVYRALSYVDSKDNTESLEDYGFTVSHQASAGTCRPACRRAWAATSSSPASRSPTVTSW